MTIATKEPEFRAGQQVSEKDKKGHAAHTMDMEKAIPLPGKVLRPIKITMLGAGSGARKRQFTR